VAADMQTEAHDEIAGPTHPVDESRIHQSGWDPHEQPMMSPDVGSESVGSHVHDGLYRIDERAQRGERGSVFDLTRRRKHATLWLREQSSPT
jgi:hypothetical protein